MWLAKTFLDALTNISMGEGYGLWVGMSGFSGLVTNFMSDAATVALVGPIVIPMGIMTGVAGEPWATGLSVAFASSYAHFLVVGSPTNALTYALGQYPDSNKRVITTMDFVKYGLVLWFLSMALLWVVELLVIYPFVGFPDGILESATNALEGAAIQVNQMSMDPGGH